MKYIDSYTDYLTSTGKSVKTITNYVGRLKRLEKEIGKPTTEMDFTDIHKMLSILVQENCSDATRKAYMDAFKSHWKYLKKFGYTNITEDTDQIKVERRPPQVPSKEELKAMLSKAYPFPRDYAILITFIATGLRISELAELKWEQIDGDVIRVKGKGRKWRTLYLHPDCLSAIYRYKRERGEYVFESYTGHGMTTRAIHDIVKKYTTYSAHKLRHYFGTEFYARCGNDLRATQEALGHGSPATTQIYVHVAQERIKQTMTSGGIL